MVRIANNIAKVFLFPNYFAPGRSGRYSYLGKMGQEEPESEVAKRESVPSKRRGGTGHNFWEIKKGSGLELPPLAGGHYAIFLYLWLVFLLTKFSVRDLLWCYGI